MGIKATASSKHVEFDLAGTHHDDDERDPLEILGGSSGHYDHRPVDTYAAASSPAATAAAASLGPEVSVRAPPMVRAPTLRAADRERRDSCEAIDAILRSSKDVRDRISSRQARVFEAYKVESHKLNKELAHLPATYDQYLAVREKAKSRRKQRSIANNDELVSHPLEFHLLRGTESLSPSAGRNSVVENEPTTEEEIGAAHGSDLEAEATGGAEEEEGNSSGSDNGISPTYLKEEGGSIGQKGAHESSEQAAFRRCSTRARAGSAAENFTARQQFTCCHQEERRQHSWKPRESPCKEEVPALRRSKIRGRYMVFSLLEAARDEEEDMEKRIIASKEATSSEERKEREDLFQKLDEARSRNARKLDALMTEYNPRPSRSRRDNTFEKLRVALPLPSASEDDSRFGAGGGYGGNGNPYAQSERKEGGEKESRWDNAGSGDGCTGGVSDGDHRDCLEGGPLASADYVNRVDRSGGVTVSETTECHRESYGSNSQGCQPSEALEGNEGGAVRDGAGMDGPLMSPPPQSFENRSTVAGDEKDKNDAGAGGRQGDGGRAVTADPRKRPATSQRKVPTLPDPNEVNNSVMADPFNMDHLKDLPGLTGGCNRGLSALVSEAVTYIDPAFPNLEFHRRAAMDRAGYFMPGYKPRVISPGPDAGAYWLERRQSYRVKMAAPPHEQQKNPRQRGALINTAPPPTAACPQATAQHPHNEPTGRRTPNTSKR